MREETRLCKEDKAAAVLTDAEIEATVAEKLDGALDDPRELLPLVGAAVDAELKQSIGMSMLDVAIWANTT